MKHSVFAYGSNLDLTELSGWLSARGYAPSLIFHAQRAALFGHALVWNYYSSARRGGAASVRARVGAVVHGAVLKVSDAGLAALDRKEGAPRVYCRRLTPIQLDHGRWEQAWVYRVTADFVKPHFVAPTHDYRQRLLDGAEAFGLPRAHIEMIRAVRVCSG